jgi:hypothetical protein
VESVDIKLEQPIRQFVEHKSREGKVPPEQTVTELVSLGFETLFRELYDRYRRGEISFGRLAQELGLTSWELSHLLEERGWTAHNLPS